MDIVVTIPKSEYANDDKETEQYNKGGYEQFWTMKKEPNHLYKGDRVFFVRNSKVESSMRVDRIERQATTKCETTERIWSGVQIFMDDLREENVPNVKGFQGFRYRWW